MHRIIRHNAQTHHHPYAQWQFAEFKLGVLNTHLDFYTHSCIVRYVSNPILVKIYCSKFLMHSKALIFKVSNILCRF